MNGRRNVATGNQKVIEYLSEVKPVENMKVTQSLTEHCQSNLIWGYLVKNNNYWQIWYGFNSKTKCNKSSSKMSSKMFEYRVTKEKKKAFFCLFKDFLTKAPGITKSSHQWWRQTDISLEAIIEWYVSIRNLISEYPY